MVPQPVTLAFALSLAASALTAQQGTLVTETEPNDDIASANLIRLGDTISGTKTYRNVDFFAFDLAADSKVVLSVPHKTFCVGMAFHDRDGRMLQSRDCHNDRPPYDTLRATITTAGRYYVSVWHPPDIETPGDEGRVFEYKLLLARYEAPAPGIGNPLTRLTTIDGEIGVMVAAPDGDMLVAYYPIDGFQRHRIARLSSDGRLSPFASDVTMNGQMAIDAFGDLLVPSGDQGGVVWRYDLKTGARTIFTTPPPATFSYTGITIGADGDVWLSTPGTSPEGATLARFDAFGTFKSRVTVGVRTFALTTAQNGEIFFIAQNSGDVYRLANNTTPVRVISGTSAREQLALDQDGWVYLYHLQQGKLLLYNAQYELARDPLAQVLDSVRWKDEHMMAGPSWMRDRNGKITTRLLVTRGPGRQNDTQGPREILKVNERGIRAPGADPTLRLKRKSLRIAAVNVAYADTLQLSDGTATWSVVSGQLPDGVTLTSTGVLTGTPSRKGTFEFVARAANGPRAGFGRFAITVNEAPVVQVSVEEITNALLGGTNLPPATVQYLDYLGNKNGRLDVGDLRAYLRAQGQLSGAHQP